MGSAHDDWSGTDPPEWQVQQEALTIFQQAPSAGASGGGPRTNCECKAERLDCAVCFESSLAHGSSGRKAQQHESIEVGRIVGAFCFDTEELLRKHGYLWVLELEIVAVLRQTSAEPALAEQAVWPKPTIMTY